MNLSDGLGLVYNPGEVVLGTSAPLYAVLLAALARVAGTGSFPELVLWVNALADCLSIALVYLIARRLRVPRWPSVLASVVVALSPLVIRYSIGGMETSVLTAMCLSSAYLYLQRRDLAAFLLAGLAVWVRPDALAFAALPHTGLPEHQVLLMTEPTFQSGSSIGTSPHGSAAD